MLVEKYVGGIKLSTLISQIDMKITREFLLDIMEQMLERVAYLHDVVYMMHRDLHPDQWFV